ncbi:hypothetical protein [Micromonospora sp. NPDC048830]|uniref:effector-associated constant component EACC1 n=1 Tax=Micromonospora sp. NPDC048830 TaxID=3364257 RepID=UPI003717E3CA
MEAGRNLRMAGLAYYKSVTGPLEVSIRVDDQGSLYRWLMLDPEVRRDATVTLTPAPPKAGEMGGALDVINVVLSNGIAIGSLLVAVSSWRESRPRPPVTRIERDGISIAIEDASPETVRRVVEALIDRPADPGDGTL